MLCITTFDNLSTACRLQPLHQREGCHHMHRRSEIIYVPYKVLALKLMVDSIVLGSSHRSRCHSYHLPHNSEVSTRGTYLTSTQLISKDE